jgi:hypothetical protein
MRRCCIAKQDGYPTALQPRQGFADRIDRTQIYRLHPLANASPQPLQARLTSGSLQFYERFALSLSTMQRDSKPADPHQDPQGIGIVCAGCIHLEAGSRSLEPSNRFLLAPSRLARGCLKVKAQRVVGATGHGHPLLERRIGP